MPEQRTSLIIPISESTSQLQLFRQTYIKTAGATLPPHITLHDPFIASTELSQKQIIDLAQFFASQPSWTAIFQQVAHFTENSILYLKPDDDLPFQRLRQALYHQWANQIPLDPYPTRTMHLTLARYTSNSIAQIERAFHEKCGKILPITSQIDRVCVYERQDHYWQQCAEFPLSAI